MGVVVVSSSRGDRTDDVKEVKNRKEKRFRVVKHEMRFKGEMDWLPAIIRNVNDA